MNHDEQNNEQIPFPVDVPLLQDISHYLQENGILPGHSNAPIDETGTFRTQDQLELEATLNAQQQYGSDVINKFVKEDEEISINACEDQRTRKQNLLKKFKGVSISIQTRDNQVVSNVPIDSLIDLCDTFLTLASSEHWSSFVNQDFIFQLEQFQKDAVECFLNIVQIRFKSSTSISDLINSDHIIECCYIAHFLQATEVTDEIVSVIQLSIDSENCTSICVLADELQIPSLLQASMKFIMERLDNIENDGEIWNDIPAALKHHIITLRNAAKSSIIGRGQTKEVIFSSAGEFLAIFHDTLTCQKERLNGAKQRQEEIIQERLRESEGLGRFSRRFVQETNVYGGSVEDASKKIRKQEERVKTLQAFYKEQKAIFAKDMQSDSQFRGKFSL